MHNVRSLYTSAHPLKPLKVLEKNDDGYQVLIFESCLLQLEGEGREGGGVSQIKGKTR